ncbi:hypothetical protein BDFB_009735, partial [Asbolus verrucosus]
MNLLYHAAKIMISHFRHEQIPITLEQKKLLGISDAGFNYSLSSPSWTYHKVNPDLNPPSFPPNSPLINNIQYRDTSGIEFISDENDLDKYLKEFEANTSIKNLNNQTQQSSNLLSSFWSHPVTKTAKDMSTFLRKCTYQLSTQSPSKCLFITWCVN